MNKNILKIKENVSKHKRNKNDLYMYYIKTRLNKSLKTYMLHMEEKAKYLELRKPENVIKRM